MIEGFDQFKITTDKQLRELAKIMGFEINYIGFAEDLKTTPKGFNIINLGGPETNRQGTHWVLWYVDPGMKFGLYLDSYGAPPEDNVLKLSPDPLWVNGKQLQGYNEDYCGVWALIAASFINKEKNKEKALHKFISQYKEVN